MASTIISQEVWESSLAQRLDKPQNWKEINDVIYTDKQTMVLPYISAANEPAVQTAFMATAAARNTLSNVIAPGVVTMATETLQIVSMEYVSEYVDYADQVQSNYVKDAEIGNLLGKKIGERLEAIVLAEAANRTNFGEVSSGVYGLSANQITIAPNNVDDVWRGIIEQIYTANGFNLYRENGAAIVWRPADWTHVTAYMQANGFSVADAALKNGATIGIDYAGVYHYVSTQHTANHLWAGVRKITKLGLLTGGAMPFGSVRKVDDPASSTAGHLSGSNFYSRLDYGFKTQTNVAGLVFDGNVA